MSAFPYFYGLKMGFIKGHFYKVFIADDMLCGARIAGKHYDEESLTSLHRHSPAKHLRPLFLKSVKKRYQTEETYELIHPASTQFLKQSKHNFQLRLSDIVRIKFTTDNGAWTQNVYTCGRINIYLKNDRNQSLALIDNQVSEVESILRPILPGVEITIDDRLQHHTYMEQA